MLTAVHDMDIIQQTHNYFVYGNIYIENNIKEHDKECCDGLKLAYRNICSNTVFDDNFTKYNSCI